MTLRRSTQTLEQRIHAPSVRPPSGPVCTTCGRTVDSEALVEGEPGRTTYAKVLVRHHGAEELRRFEMGSVEWDENELASHMRRCNWFDPLGDGLGLGSKIKPLDDGVNDTLEQTKPTAIVPADIGRTRKLGVTHIVDPSGNPVRSDGGGS